MSTQNWSIQYCRSSQTTPKTNQAIRLLPRRNSYRSRCVDCGDWSKHRQNRSWVADKEPHHGAESTRTPTKCTVGSLVAETELSGGKIQGQSVSSTALSCSAWRNQWMSGLRFPAHVSMIDTMYFRGEQSSHS